MSRKSYFDRLPFGLGCLRRINVTLLVTMVALMVIGVFFVYSANSIRESLVLRSLYKAHASMGAVGIVVVLLMARLDYRWLVKWSWLFYLITLGLLVAVLLVGEVRLGAQRWVYGIQPSELAKLATILLLARLLERPAARRDIWEFLLAAGVVVLPVILILLQPDLGTALVFVPILYLLLFVSGTALRAWLITLLTALVAAGVVLGAVLLQESPETPAGIRQAAHKVTFFLGDYQRRRLVDVLYPERDPLNLGWNRRQSQIAVGSGGMWGKGFLKGDQNLLGYLPQQVSANDFIFSVLAEEKGYVGAVVVLLLYAGVILSILRVAVASHDGYGRTICTGVAALFFCHVFINIAMTIGVLPVTGLPLPFLSYGRTFMLTAILAVGLVQSVAVHGPWQQRAEVET